MAYDRMNTFVISSTIYQSEPGLTFGVTNTTFGKRAADSATGCRGLRRQPV